MTSIHLTSHQQHTAGQPGAQTLSSEIAISTSLGRATSDFDLRFAVLVAIRVLATILTCLTTIQRI